MFTIQSGYPDQVVACNVLQQMWQEKHSSCAAHFVSCFNLYEQVQCVLQGLGHAPACPKSRTEFVCMQAGVAAHKAGSVH